MTIWRWDGFLDYLFNAYLLQGALISVTLTAGSLACGLVIGLCIAVLRLSGSAVLRGFAVFCC